HRYYHYFLPAGVYAHGAGGEAVSPAGLYQNLYYAGRRPAGHYPGAGADLFLYERKVPAAGQPGEPSAGAYIRARGALGAALAQDHPGPEHSGPVGFHSPAAQRRHGIYAPAG